MCAKPVDSISVFAKKACFYKPQKLCAAACVYNEGDIIESFCRYTVTIFDALVLYDRGCEDDSIPIIQSLIAEGLPIYLLRFLEPDPVAKTYKASLVSYSFNNLAADLVFIFDPDEFLVHVKGENPRNVLEQIDVNKEYHVYWRTAIYEDFSQDEPTFIPRQFHSFRSTEYEKYAKPIVTRKLYEKYGATIGQAVHHLNYPSNPNEDKVETDVLDSLFLAHYPVRSASQILTKVIPTRIDAKYRGGDEGRGYHQETIYDVVRRVGILSSADLQRISTEFALPAGCVANNISIDMYDFPAKFAGNISIHYTKMSPEERLSIALLVIFNHFEKTTDRYQTDIMHWKEEFAHIETALANIIKKDEELEAEKIKLEKEQQKILSSRTWKFGTSIQKVYRTFFRKS